MAKIGIILGSTRKGRNGEAVARWVEQMARQRGQGQDSSTQSSVEYELLDVKEFNLPLFESETLPMMAGKKYDDAAVQAWSNAVDSCDAFVFVTAEYNHSVPAAFKNAVDSLGPEWVGKPVSFVGYSYAGGIRAIEAWRLIVANFSMPQLRPIVEISLMADFTDGAFTPAEFKAGALNGMLDELEAAIQ